MKFTFILSLVRKPNQWLELEVTSKGKTYDQKAAFGPPTSPWGPHVPVKRVRYISVAATATSTAPVMPKDSLWTTRGRRHATISGLSGLWTSGRCSRSNYSQLKASWSCRFFSRMNRVRKPSRFPASQFTRQFASWKISHQIQVYLADMQRAHNNLCASSNTHTQ